ncbi:Zinc finger CCCH domain-containing protein 23 [Ananas comosus]|uniref:Zinc finger CCCH domain-containing protein 23 n=1 Tax=Ananas comosus TaxID=4615 RepID=A0A199VEM3_ANACO|nr:Zinc finger CCCH domain-containing protein 23 [Ananas comosus]
MVISDVNYGNPTVHTPPWHVLEDRTALMGHCVPVSGVTCRGNTGAVSPFVLGEAALAALRRSLVRPRGHYVDESYDSSSSSLSSEGGEEEEEEEWEEDSWEVYASTDGFRMYEFKVRACRRRRSHNWTECPFAHPGEKAARRDPRRFTYSGEPCPEFRRRGACERGDACDLAHGVFECWLHPARYRTQPCKDGTACRRPVCFFAHTLAQLRFPLPLPLPLPPHHTACCPASKSRRRSMKEKRIFSSSPRVEAAMAELRLCKSMPSSWKYRCNAAGFESTSTNTSSSSSSSSSSSVPSTIVMAPEQQYSWCAEDSVEEESAAAAEMSAPNFDWVSDLLK